MKIVCIGDSLTFGYGIKKDLCWVELLKKSTSYSIVNKGVNGDTTAGILSRLYKDVTAHNYDICIIMAGTNDLFMGRNVNTIIENIELMLKECLENKIIPLVLAPPLCYEDLAKTYWYPSINYSNVNKQISMLRDNLLQLCNRKSIILVDLTVIIPLHKDYYLDGVHINELGNSFIYKAVIEKINNIN